MKHAAKTYLPFLVLATALAGCKFQRAVDIHVRVRDNGTVVAGAEVFLNGKLVGTTDAQGALKIRTTSEPDSYVIGVSDPNLDVLHAPQTKEFASSRPLFEDALEVDFELQRVSAPKLTTLEDSVLNNVFASRGTTERDLPPEVVPTEAPKPLTIDSQPIADITVPTPVATEVAPLSDAMASEDLLRSLKEVDLSVEASQPKTVSDERPTERLHSTPNNFVVTSYLGGTPMANTMIFVGRKSQRTAAYLGTTDRTGTLAVNLPKEFYGETLIARHQCCVPLSRPLAAGSGQKTLRVDLNQGAGHDVFALNYAYGTSRGVENASLLGKGDAQIDSSNAIGFLLAGTKWLATKYKVQSKDSIQGTIEIEAENLATQLKPFTVYFSPLRPPKPTIAFAEDFADSESNNTDWRRFRRDFQARFLQTSVFKPVIASETSRLVNLAGLTVSQLGEKGWEFTPLKEYFDAVVFFEKNDGKFVARLKDRSAKTLFEFSALEMAEPEKTSSKTFAELIKRFPFEGAVTSQDGNKVIVNMGASHGRNLMSGQLVEFHGSADGKWTSPPSEQIARGKIARVRDSDCEVLLDKESQTTKLAAGTIAIRSQEDVNAAGELHAKKETQGGSDGE